MFVSAQQSSVENEFNQKTFTWEELKRRERERKREESMEYCISLLVGKYLASY